MVERFGKIESGSYMLELHHPTPKKGRNCLFLNEKFSSIISPERLNKWIYIQDNNLENPWGPSSFV